MLDVSVEIGASREMYTRWGESAKVLGTYIKANAVRVVLEVPFRSQRNQPVTSDCIKNVLGLAIVSQGKTAYI